MNENLNPETPAENEMDLQNANAESTGVVETAKESAKKTLESLSKDEIIEQVKNIVMRNGVAPRAEVEALKQAYYRLRSEVVEQEKQAFLETEGNEEKDFAPSVDPSEDVLKTYLKEIKNKRAKQIEEDEKVREDNYKKKLQIIENIKALVGSSDDFNKLYKEFKELQDKWNSIKHVPQAKERDLWSAYQVQSELFYDLIKINNEFRDYDFKKNLELKTKLCEATDKLVAESDSVSAFHQLQNYHKQWREIGPVAREVREEIWNRFKTASTEINKNYQTHFESLKGQEDENLIKKTAICDRLKTIDFDKLSSFKQWNDKTTEVIALQTEWKTIGFVPRKVNTRIFEEFRALCDAFFEKKSDFFKGMKDDMDVNLDKKKALVEKAKALKDSIDWKETTEHMIAIQKEWKTIGPVPRKYSDLIWKEFVTACDFFFEQKKAGESQEKAEEVENLAAKKAIVEKIKALDESTEANALLTELRHLSDEWHKIGFVPFRDKDKCYKEFHKVVDSHYDRLKIDKEERRMENFKSNLEDIAQHGNSGALRKERDQLMYKYNKLKSDLHTYENNMSFLSVSSKGANSLLKDVNIKIEKLKSEMDLLAQKINAIDAAIKELG